MKPSNVHTPVALFFTTPHTSVPQLTWSDIARRAHYKPRAIAQLCCVSLRTVQRHFQKHYQTTFTTWLTHHRMEEARRRILSGSSLKEVCFDLGYKQPSHFTRVFKAHYSFPPSYLATQQRHLPLFSRLNSPAPTSRSR
jgi:AraC-like DNA-binding protein